MSSSSFEGTDEPAGEPCAEKGGVEFKVEGSSQTQYACNGAEGASGSPWTLGGTLPVGATETGSWAFSGSFNDKSGYVPISFPIPLATELDGAHVINVTGPSAHCAGSYQNPTADSGYLCVYRSNEIMYAGPNAILKNITGNNPTATVPGALTSGAVLRLEVAGKFAEEEALEEEANNPGGPDTNFTPSASGTFAVTG